MGLIAGWMGYSKVMASEGLQVERVDVRGSHFLSEGEVRELMEPALGTNILAVNIHDLKRRLRASPWVADATVTRALPNALQVEIRERVPLALAEVERLFLMDGEGFLEGGEDAHGSSVLQRASGCTFKVAPVYASRWRCAPEYPSMDPCVPPAPFC